MCHYFQVNFACNYILIYVKKVAEISNRVNLNVVSIYISKYRLQFPVTVAATDDQFGFLT